MGLEVFKGYYTESVAVRVDSLRDLARLASAGAARMAISPIYRFKVGGASIYAVQSVYKDFYRLYGLPIVYYAVVREDVEDDMARYLLIRVDEEGEKVEVHRRVRPGWIAIPIINLAEKPPFMSISLESGAENPTENF